VDARTVAFHALVKYDHETGAATRYDYPPGWFASESPFAPRPGARGEDDGYVVTVATHASSFASECWVFHAPEVERGPVARVKLPSRVPTGFHAKWIPGDRAFGG
jgi:carotenoid cleavage dioxygenase